MSLGDSASPLGKVRGLGSAREGGEHWLTERSTSIALLLLGTWLVASLLFLPNFERQTIIEWLRAPTGAVPMALLIVIGFRHALDGLKVVVDDYVHEEGSRYGWNVVFLFLAVGGGALALYALGEIVFGGVA
jgi:succinate dehydrogenase / fumarate reductase, membrane anchor subunit